MAESPVPELKQVTRDRTTIAIPKAMRLDLARLRRELGFKTNGGLLRYMILETTRGELIAPANYQLVMARLGNRPVIMAGPSGAGKTTTVKAILAEWPGSVFILDMGDEYQDFKRLDFGKFYAVNWQHEGQRLRFVPNSNTQISQAEASNIFGHLNFIKSGGALKNWCVVIEEAHRFSSDPNLRALFVESRKFCRKVIVVTAAWRDFQDIAVAVKPPPWESSATIQTGDRTPDPKPTTGQLLASADCDQSHDPGFVHVGLGLSDSTLSFARSAAETSPSPE